MKVSQLLNQDKVTLSFEVFPPKTSSSYESVAHATQEIAALRPDFMSVTYGAGGVRANTLSTSRQISRRSMMLPF